MYVYTQEARNKLPPGLRKSMILLHKRITLKKKKINSSPKSSFIFLT